MRRCECGAPVGIFSLYPVCQDCLQDYLAELPARPGFTIDEFQFERRQARQAAAADARVKPVPQRVRLLDTVLDALTLPDVMRLIEEYVDVGIPRQLVTVNVDFVRIAQENHQFRHIVNNSDLSVADGKPLLWAARWTGQELPARITGMDLVLGSAELAARRNESMFLLGAAEGVAAKAANVLRASYPGLEVHSYSPPFGPFSDEENAHMVRLIRESGAKYLFVAFGAPKQDVWINEHLQELGVPVCAGVGGVFNFLAGTVRRAPEWCQRLGFEWLYRVMQEPTRLWRRYFLEDLPVFARMLMEPAVTEGGLAPQTMPRWLAPAHATAIPDYEMPVVVELERAVGS
jgi:N-acetylglucosaminyldiphosphoundecaprenol N-acetyl-beta-D-mannosaminyltransferase